MCVCVRVSARTHVNQAKHFNTVLIVCQQVLEVTVQYIITNAQKTITSET
jgi:hypothetical protein